MPTISDSDQRGNSLDPKDGGFEVVKNAAALEQKIRRLGILVKSEGGQIPFPSVELSWDPGDQKIGSKINLENLYQIECPHRGSIE
jgi:hypothetical protein